MPLAVGVTALTAALSTSWVNVLNTPPTAASEFANANMTFAMTGIPMTIDTGLLAPGQTVAGFTTVSPGAVSGTGIGGIDVPAPGMGLAAAKAILVTQLTTAFANVLNTPPTAASSVANAILAFLSQAKVMTTVTGTVPPGAAVPPPAGPVGPAAYTGAGIGGIEIPAGPGLSTGLAACISSLSLQFANVMNTPVGVASGIADALELFFMTGMVNTVANGTASGGPAAVDPLSGSGSTLPPGSPATGTGTGTIV